MLHANDWQSFYAARADSELGNNNSSVYTEAWSPDKSDATRFQTLVPDIDNVVFGVDHDKNMHALHSFKVSGGSLLRPSTKLMCLLGTGSRATAFIIDRPANPSEPMQHNRRTAGMLQRRRSESSQRPSRKWPRDLSRLHLFSSSPLASRHGHFIGNKQLCKAHSGS